MIYIPLWLKLFLFSQKQKAFDECNTALFVLFIKVQRGAELEFSGLIKKKEAKTKTNQKNSFPSYTNRRGKEKKKKTYCIVSRVIHCTTGSDIY